MAELDPAHVEAAHHVTVIQTDNPHAPLHLCSVCKAATYFQAPELPCPGPVVSLSDHDALLAALVRAGVLSGEDEGEPSGYRVMDGRRQTRRRLFTSWEDVDD